MTNFASIAGKIKESIGLVFALHYRYPDREDLVLTRFMSLTMPLEMLLNRLSHLRHEKDKGFRCVQECG